MSKLFKTKNFIIIQGVIIMFVISSATVGVYGVSSALLNLLAKIFGGWFGVCIDMGADPFEFHPILPCSYNYVMAFDFVLVVLVIVYLFAFIIHKLRK